MVRLICTALRSHDPVWNVGLAETAARFRDDGLTGWDLAGPEAAFPDPLTHAWAFEAARAGGLRITLHAGEWGGAAQVRRALALDPERIAHGPGAVDDPELCAELTARGITLDLCPTSNWQAGIVPSIAAHPLARLHRAGVPVTLSTDDTTVSDLTLSEEYVRAVEAIGLTLPELWAIDRHALDVAFADEMPTSSRCASAFDAWARRDPRAELGPRSPLEERGELRGVRGDRGRPPVGRQRVDLGPRRDPGQHQDAARPDRLRRREVGHDPVADHDRLAPARDPRHGPPPPAGTARACRSRSA